MLKNRTISSILRYCKTKPRFLDIVTKTALFQNRTNQGRVIPRPYCIDISVVVLRITIIQNNIKGIKANKTWKIFREWKREPNFFPFNHGSDSNTISCRCNDKRNVSL